METAAAALTRDPFMPGRPPGMRIGLVLALLAHLLLIVGLAYNVDWHASEPAAVEAELWSALPQQAAPEPAQAVKPPPPEPPQPQPPRPRPQVVQPPPPPQVDPQIAIEKAKESKRIETQQALAEQEKARREKARKDQARQDDLDRQQAERQEQQTRDDDARRKQQQIAKAKADRDKSERADKVAAAQQAAVRAAQMKRMQGLAGASGDSTATGNALRSSGPSAGYGGRIKARIKPNIVFPEAIDGNPTASVEVRVAPDGSIIGRRLVQSSGSKTWDDAVLRAIDRTDGLPRDIDGRVPPLIVIDFKPREL